MRKLVPQFYDDLDGNAVTEDDLRARSLVVDGVAYTLDLRTTNSQLLDEALAPFLKVASPDTAVDDYPADVALLDRPAAPPPEPPEEPAAPQPALEVDEGPKAPLAEPEPPAAEPLADLPEAFELLQKPDDGLTHCDYPGCDFSHQRAASVGVHKKFRHGITGTSDSQAYRRGQQPERLQQKTSQVDDPLACVHCASQGIHWRAAAPQGLGVHLRFKHGVVGESRATQHRRGEGKPEPVGATYAYMCEVPGCDFPGTDRIQTFRTHQRMKHGIGGKSSAEIMNERRAKAAEVQAAKERHAAERRAAEAEPAPAPTDVAQPHGKPSMDKAMTKLRDGLAEEVTGGGKLKLVTTPQEIKPGIHVSGTGKGAKRNDGVILSDELAKPEPGEFDWASLGDSLEAASQVARSHLRNGIPPSMRFTYYPDLLGIEGLDLDIVEAALRYPERVEVAPETFEKRYTILRFHKGDCLVALGMRTPNQPQVIAAYHGSLLANDTHRVNHTGSGGRRAQAGLPRTARDTMNRLQARGAQLIQKDGAATAEVRYKGNDLGKISTGAATPRDTAESDYQRAVRRMDAVDRRAGANRRVTA